MISDLPNKTNSEIERDLRRSLRMYTSLWFISCKDQKQNLEFTFILLSLHKTINMIDHVKRMALGV